MSDGLRHGINSYTAWFAGDAEMSGEYFGYDGPFPPWNDRRTHNYTFTIYALDVDRAPVDGTFDGPALLPPSKATSSIPLTSGNVSDRRLAGGRECFTQQHDGNIGDLRWCATRSRPGT